MTSRNGRFFLVKLYNTSAGRPQTSRPEFLSIDSLHNFHLAFLVHLTKKKYPKIS
nr:MAG TPA: hypothetical protein [Caudoviricetes sp.]